MGAVILARDKAIQRELAVKVMRPQIADSEEHRLRFLEEAQVTGQLEHPNIVPIHELGKDAEGNLYFTMKLVKGKSLGEILKELKSVGVREFGSLGEKKAEKPGSAQTPTPPDSHTPTPSLSELLGIFLKVCDGMAFAHSKGVIHRDLKPDNIMVGEFGEVQIMDWGLAKVVGASCQLAASGEQVSGVSVQVSGEEEQPGASVLKPLRQAQGGELRRTTETRHLKPGAPGTRNQKPETELREADTVRSVRSDSDVALTVDGQITGTPAYMPPEQAEGKIDLIDHRSDIYSLGAILYEILTLERPIEGDTVHKVLLNVADGKITPPEQRTPGRHVPKELSAVVMKAMAKNRRKRYQSVQELSQDIKLFLEGRSVSAKEDTVVELLTKFVKRNKAVSAAVGVGLVVLVGVVAVFMIRLKGERDRAIAGENKALVAEERQRETALAASKRFASQAIRAAEAGRWDEAERRAEDAETVALKTPWGAYAKGSFARMKHDYEKAAESFRKALATDPGHQESQAALSEALASMGQIADVEKLLASIDEIKDWRTLLKAGRTLYAANRWRECQRPLELGLKLMEKDKDAPEGLRNKTSEEIGEMIDTAKARVACDGFYDEIRDLPPDEQIKRVEAKLSEVNGLPIKASKNVVLDGVWVEAWMQCYLARRKHLYPLQGLGETEYWGMERSKRSGASERDAT